MPAHRHAEIDALRGVIILLVLVSSYVTLYQSSFGHTRSLAAVPAVGFLALQLFLAVASYRLAVELAQSGSALAYIRARVVHYLPALWPAVALTCAAAAYAPLPIQTCPNLASLIANLVMAPDLVGLPVAAPCLWRLKLELLMSAGLGSLWFALGGRLCASAVLPLLGLQALTTHGADPAHLHVLTLTGALTLDGYLAPCAFGMAIFHLRAQPRDIRWQAVAAVSLALLFLIGTPVHEAWAASALLLFALAAFGQVPSLARFSVLTWLGRMSFPIYVVHQVPGFVVIRLLEAAGVHPLLAVIAAGAAATAAGALIHYAVAVPASAWLTRVLAGRGRGFARDGHMLWLPRRTGLFAPPARNLRPAET